MSALLLLLADGRLPAGGHAHSGGIEAAVSAGLVSDTADLGDWLDGRMATTGTVDAAVAVCAWRIAGVDDCGGSAGDTCRARLRALDVETAARMGSPAIRAASRAQGRGLLRVSRRCWDASPRPPLAAAARRGEALGALGHLHPDGPLVPVVLGVVGAIGGLDALDVATAALWSALSGPAWAAVRLLGLDPLDVTAALAGRTAAVDRVAGETAAGWGAADRPLADLPALGAPLLDIGAEAHAAWEVRLFAS